MIDKMRRELKEAQEEIAKINQRIKMLRVEYRKVREVYPKGSRQAEQILERKRRLVKLRRSHEATVRINGSLLGFVDQHGL